MDGDGTLDLLLAGNLDATQPEFGRYDAGRGLLLKGVAGGNFEAVEANASGFFVKGEGRDVGKVRSPTGKVYYVVTRSNDAVLIFRR